MIRYIIIFVVGYFLYKISKPYLRKILNPSEKKKVDDKRVHVDKSKIVDADFEDVTNNDNNKQ